MNGTTTIDVELTENQTRELGALAQHEGKELHEVVECAITRYVEWLRGRSAAELESYLNAMRIRPDGIG